MSSRNRGERGYGIDSYILNFTFGSTRVFLLWAFVIWHNYPSPVLAFSLF